MMRLFCLALMLFGLGSCDNTDPASVTLVLLANSCGEILVGGDPPRANNSNAARQSANCFVQSFQSCRATSLTIRENNTVTRQFTIEPNSSTCTLRQALQTDPNSPPAVADCQRARMEKNTFVVESCSHLGDYRLTP